MQPNLHDVAAVMRTDLGSTREHFIKLARVAQDSLAHKKSHCEFLIVARRAHGDRHALAHANRSRFVASVLRRFKPNFERFFNRNEVIQLAQLAAFKATRGRRNSSQGGFKHGENHSEAITLHVATNSLAALADLDESEMTDDTQRWFALRRLANWVGLRA
jgi:hypothetical protein